jgi:hypothetical protein
MTTTQVCSLRGVRSLLAGLVLSVGLLSLVGVAAPTANADAVDADKIAAPVARTSSAAPNLLTFNPIPSKGTMW